MVGGRCGNKETTSEVCEQHYGVFVPDRELAELAGGGRSLEWRQLSIDYFVVCGAGGSRKEMGDEFDLRTVTCPDHVL